MLMLTEAKKKNFNYPPKTLQLDVSPLFPRRSFVVIFIFRRSQREKEISAEEEKGKFVFVLDGVMEGLTALLILRHANC